MNIMKKNTILTIGSIILIVAMLTVITYIIAELDNITPNAHTIQALCPFTVNQILAMCNTYGLSHNTVSDNSITCYSVENGTSVFGIKYQPDGPTPTGWIIYNYTKTSCTIFGWQNV